MTIIRLVKKIVHKNHKRNQRKKFHKKSLFNQKGKSRLLVIFFVSLVAVPLIVGGLSFVLSKKTSISLLNLETGVSVPSIQPTLNPNCDYNDPELCKYLTNVKNYENVSSISVGTEGDYGRNPTEIISEYLDKNTYHMIIKQNGKETSNYINIGDTSYDYDYYKKIWWKDTLTAEEKQLKKNVPQQMKKFALEHQNDPHHIVEYKFNAKESCGNKMCFKYERYYLDQPEVKTFFWFDDQEYLKRRERFVDPVAGVIESTYSYGNVHISAPYPVEESRY